MGNTQEDDPSYNRWEILEGKETTLTLPVDPTHDDFGIELIGGRHSYLNKICIHRIYNDSIAFSDGRLRRGDVIVFVNGKSMKNASLEEARDALMDSTGSLRITIFREIDPMKLFTSLEEPKVFVTAELWKSHMNEPLGLSLLERKGTGVFVTWINPDSPAGKCHRIRQGDKIVDINGRPVKGMDQAQVTAILREAEYSVVIVFGRVPSLFANIQKWARDQSPPQNAPRNSTWSASDITAALRVKKAKFEDTPAGTGKQNRRFSAFNLRLRSNSAQIERLAIQSGPQGSSIR